MRFFPKLKKRKRKGWFPYTCYLKYLLFLLRGVSFLVRSLSWMLSTQKDERTIAVCVTAWLLEVVPARPWAIGNGDFFSSVSSLFKEIHSRVSLSIVNGLFLYVSAGLYICFLTTNTGLSSIADSICFYFFCLIFLSCYQSRSRDFFLSFF